MSALSATEIDVLRLRAEGLKRREIAATRTCAEATVKTILYRTARKLDARNTTHAIAIAIREGWM